MAQAKYKEIAEFIKKQIDTNVWPVGYKIPSETDLSVSFSASRMTARKAVDEVANLGLLKRIPSVGTFVEGKPAKSSLLEIKNIADEITARGHYHQMTVLSKMTIVPNGAIANTLSSFNSKVFKILIIHSENGVPIQLEERYVSAKKVPHFLEQDFSKITASEYLSSVCPLTDAEIEVEAIMPSKILRHNLQIDENIPCIKVSRSTQSNGQPISLAILYYPSDKYKLTSSIHIVKQG
ncbi:UTRA domain-containing protein [Thalassotalea piscium]|uniref:GntR family histidine utilization transcriptional repressor n=1 Tax=Thalassotalea piscium TaxID=1230533 RepID=A0A7X0NG23_9GAMM|nr:UTRA domain-containing protein [Thalassotalea piscium]MBB6542793.1 GntR family histidine utilization transcriptional repressor [Thalassotalea piscium]